jgi:hypothetical protein
MAGRHSGCRQTNGTFIGGHTGVYAPSVRPAYTYMPAATGSATATADTISRID